MPRVRLGRYLPQPGQHRLLATLLALEERLQSLAMVGRQHIRQRRIDPPVGSGDRLGADAVDDFGCRQQHFLLAEPLHQGRCEHDTLVRLPGQIIQALNGAAVVARRGERRKPEGRLQLQQVFAARLPTLTIVSPDFHRNADLIGHHLQQRSEWRFFCSQDHTRISHIAKMDSEAEAVL